MRLELPNLRSEIPPRCVLCTSFFPGPKLRQTKTPVKCQYESIVSRPPGTLCSSSTLIALAGNIPKLPSKQPSPSNYWVSRRAFLLVGSLELASSPRFGFAVCSPCLARSAAAANKRAYSISTAPRVSSSF